MKIAVFHSHFSSGGLDRVVVRLTKGFVQHGHEVDVLTVSSSGKIFEDLDPGVNRVQLRPLLRLPAIRRLVSAESWTSLFSIPALARYLRKQRPDILFAASSLNAAVVANAMSLTHSKTVLRVSLHQSGSTEHDRHVTAKLVPFVRRSLFKKASMVIANSESGALDLEQSLSLDHDSVRVINNPSADPEIASKAEAEIDHQWFAQHDVPVAVSVGRLTAVKDVTTLLKAFKIVVAQTPCRLLLLGQGDEQQALQNLAVDLDIQDSVDFIGFVENPWAYMKQADLFVMSSKVEGSPNSLIEAMFLEKPVIATDCPTGPREILRDGELGHLVEVGDYKAFADAWLEILAHPERAKAKANSALKYISRYQFDTVVEEYLTLFSEQTRNTA